MTAQLDATGDPGAPWPCQTGCISDLLVSVGAGDTAAFGRLIDLVYPTLLAAQGSAAAADIDDAVGRALLSIWRDAPLYRVGETSAVRWIMRVAGAPPSSCGSHT